MFQHVRDPASAAIAGIIFSVILIVVLAQFHAAVPAGSATTEWLDESSRRSGVQLAVGLIPFAGIAFLWFIGVIRDRLGEHEDQFFSSVLFGSGLLFIAMAFIASALAGALIASYQLDPVATIENGIYTVERETIFRITNVFGVRMAGVFMFSAGTIWLRSGTMPRWMVVITYTVAIVQLFSLGFTLWFTLLFPAWVLIVSVHFLLYPPNLAEDADDTPAESASA